VSYLIPTEETSLAEQYRMRKTAIELGRARARELWKLTDSDLTERDADYVNDFIIPAGGVVAAPPIAGWLTMPLLVIGNWYSVFADNVPAAFNPAVPTNQVWVFYKVNMLELAGPDPVCGLQFRVGQALNLKAFFDMEAINGKMVSDGYFSMPVTYQNPEVCGITVECRVAIGAQARVRIGTFIIEPLQNTVI
jgi:hypothetical protein